MIKGKIMFIYKQIIVYFINDSGTEVSDNEDKDLDYKS